MARDTLWIESSVVLEGRFPRSVLGRGTFIPSLEPLSTFGG